MRKVIGYPDIVPGPSWMKSALLYWDQFCTLVPEDFEERVPPELEMLWENDHYSPLYTADLSPHSQHRLRQEMLDLATRAEDSGINFNTSPPGVEPLYYGKLPRIIESDLIDLGLAVDDGVRLTTNPALLTPLLGLAAKYLSADLSGRSDSFTVSTGSSTAAEQVFGPFGTDQPDVLVGRLVLSNALPVPGPDVTIQQILYFKEKYRIELLDFRSSFAKLVGVLQNTPSATADIEALLTDELQRIIVKLLQADTERMGWRLGGMSALIASGSVATYVGVHWPTATWFLSGIGIAAATIMTHRVRNAPAGGDFSYLLHAMRLESNA